MRGRQQVCGKATESTSASDSVKRVKRVVARLRDEGILLLQRHATQRRPATYRIAWSKATPKELYVPPKEPDW